ncbi:30S ribosome-binding factor RbfA [Leptolyngbya sp. KIOST-1]|uniref:30S ribosome-binding factor RbfA n=1 Tax=Leptolyngbya sp. KIOST-1 TaxID=1229172 RepID=UPI00055FE4E7|nr:30S ribosome-binding factor RbfA [Leptolyngbya sp. KIOST-1]
MANSRRVERVASLIKREISQMVMLDIKDDRVGAGMVSVTDVDVSGDLQHAKVFVSIYGTDEARAETMAGLKAATGFVRSELGQRLRLRRTPEIIFREDVGVERGTRVLSLINQLSQERAEKGLPDEGEAAWEGHDLTGEEPDTEPPTAGEEE